MGAMGFAETDRAVYPLEEILLLSVFAVLAER